MKKSIITICCLFIGVVSQAQILSPVKWSFSAKKIKASLYEVHMTATVDEGWKIYSQNTPEGGPIATKIVFNKNNNVLLGGKAKEVGDMHQKYEDVFGVDVWYYQEKASFVQVVKFKKEIATTLSGKVRSMVCDENRCLPEDEVEFSVELK